LQLIVTSQKEIESWGGKEKNKENKTRETGPRKKKYKNKIVKKRHGIIRRETTRGAIRKESLVRIDVLKFRMT
jgi:hypothetical protein